MNWGATIGTGVLGAAIGGAGMLGLGLLWVRWYRVSSFEGKSGYFVVFLTLVGVVAGLVISMIAARLGHASRGLDANVWSSQLSVGVGAVAGALLLALAVSYLLADREPELGGRGVVIAWEVRLPKRMPEALDSKLHEQADPRAWPSEQLRLQLVSVQGNNSVGSKEASFDRQGFRQEEGQWVLPARVDLFTSKGRLCVNLTLGSQSDGFWPPLTAASAYALAQADSSSRRWSEWQRTNQGLKQSKASDAIMFRYMLLCSDSATATGKTAPAATSE